MKSIINKWLLTLLMITVLAACGSMKKSKMPSQQEQQQVLQLMQKHLDAVTNKDLQTLASTLPEDGQMQLILPDTEIINSVEGFLNFHREWFKDKSWSFETKILNSKVHSDLAMVIVEIIYREPIRDGKPYFNRMSVSYVLEKMDGQWFVIKDHASSVKKSTSQPKI